jgi:hypothetical protein
MIPAGGVERIHASTKASLLLQSVESVRLLPLAFDESIHSRRLVVLVFGCGCERGPTRRGRYWLLCPYHQGFEDGVEAGPG